MAREVVVVSSVHIAISAYGGSLNDITPTELAALVVRECPAQIQDPPHPRDPLRAALRRVVRH